MTGDDRVDLLVVGGGIVGTWAAYQAVRAHPAWRVLVVERSLIGDGTTRFSLGFGLRLGRTARQRRMAAVTEGAYRHLSAEAGGPALNPVAIRFIVSREGQSALECSLGGTGASPLEGDERAEVAERLPGLRVAGDEVVIGAEGWYSDPAGAAGALARQVDAHPAAAVWEGATVEDIAADADGVDAELADGRRVRARRAIVAAGPRLNDGPLAGAARTRGLRVKKIVALHLDRCPQPSDPVVFYPEDDAFLLPRPDRREWLLSYTSQVWDCSSDPTGHVLTARDRAEGVELLRRRWPELAESCIGGRASCDSYSPDWTPVVEVVEGAERVVLAGGCSGSGWRLAPAIGAQVVDLVSRNGT